MITKIITFGERLRGTYWLLPAIMVTLAVILSVVMIMLDQNISLDQQDVFNGLLTTSAEGARSFLSTVAGSMIGVAGVTFSITLVALSQASSQYGPRLISNFLRDRGNQIVLGTFIATFVYCLLVLRTIQSTDVRQFVPHLAISFGIALTLVSLGVLIYFFHHISTSLQAESIIASIARELKTSIDRHFPDKLSANDLEHELRDEKDIPNEFNENARIITAKQSGYLQAIDYNMLEHIAVEHDLLLRLSNRAGDFIAQSGDLVSVWPPEQLADNLDTTINDSFIFGSQRLQLQDVEFAIQQLVEIAVRALSPGINDPFTAIACIDQLSTTLAELAERKIPGGYRYDEAGQLRVIRDVITFSGIMDAAFNQIRQYGRSSADVTIRLLEGLAIIAARVRRHEQIESVKRQAIMIKRAAADTIPEQNDRYDIDERYRLVMDIFDNDSPTTTQ